MDATDAALETLAEIDEAVERADLVFTPAFDATL